MTAETWEFETERSPWWLILMAGVLNLIVGILLLLFSISTIKTHRANIMEKLNIESPVKLIHFAIQLGLVDPAL
ncbi:MAG: LuxR C-terminal-related transcriptional regulator [Desulfobacterales bacterium]